MGMFVKMWGIKPKMGKSQEESATGGKCKEAAHIIRFLNVCPRDLGNRFHHKFYNIFKITAVPMHDFRVGDFNTRMKKKLNYKFFFEEIYCRSYIIPAGHRAPVYKVNLIYSAFIHGITIL